MRVSPDTVRRLVDGGHIKTARSAGGQRQIDAAALAGYMWLLIHRVFEFWTFLGDMRIQRVYMLVTLAAWLLYPNKVWITNRLHQAFLFFGMALAICWIASPHDPEVGPDRVKVRGRPSQWLRHA